jgi:N-acetylglucosamine-6-phosphate deacetylase
VPTAISNFNFPELVPLPQDRGPDGFHVSPGLLRILHCVPDRVYWTTDAMSAAGTPPGNYTMGDIKLAVGEVQIVRNPATNTFAGSALTPIEGIRRGAKMLNLPWQNVWDFFSVAPVRLIGLPAGLAPGSDFCVLRSGLP